MFDQQYTLDGRQRALILLLIEQEHRAISDARSRLHSGKADYALRELEQIKAILTVHDDSKAESER